MKLLRYGEPGQEKPGLLGSDGKIRDLSAEIDDLAGDNLAPSVLARLAALDPATLPAVEGSPRLGSCIAKPGKFIAIGLNYIDHAKETGLPIPDEPVVFFKSDTSICGPNDKVVQPPESTRLDYEVEIAIVIGSEARYISESDAASHVAGYCVVNDVSERQFQIERGGGQWAKGKCCDTFGPTGPWLVTPDEVENVQNLELWLDVNGERRQSGNTANMIFSCDYMVSHLSHFMTLMPGDIITTSTPAGVALGMKQPKWLQPGDIMTLGVTGLGQQQQTIVAFSG